MQKTLKNTVALEGVGLHSGEIIRVNLLPAGVDAGITFKRMDHRGFEIPALFDQVHDTLLNTRIGGEIGVNTIEHLMAAFAGLGITNAIVEIDGPEVPVLDGSSMPFIEAMWKAGIKEQAAPGKIFDVVKTVRYTDDLGAYAELSPHNQFKLSFEIDFSAKAIGKQSLSLNVENGVFVRELANCRTFCRNEDIEQLRAQGLALGGSLQNAVVIDDDEVLNQGGFRRANESVRHKALDAIGDLYLAGGFLRGHYHGYKAGHRITNELLRKAFAEGALVERKVLSTEIPTLPGFDIVSADFEH